MIEVLTNHMVWYAALYLQTAHCTCSLHLKHLFGLAVHQQGYSREFNALRSREIYSKLPIEFGDNWLKRNMF